MIAVTSVCVCVRESHPWIRQSGKFTAGGKSKSQKTETKATVKALDPFPTLVSLTADIEHTVRWQHEILPSMGGTMIWSTAIKYFLQWHFLTLFLLTGNWLYPLGILFQRSLKLVLCNAANPSEEKRQKRSEKWCRQTTKGPYRWYHSLPCNIWMNKYAYQGNHSN